MTAVTHKAADVWQALHEGITVSRPPRRDGKGMAGIQHAHIRDADDKLVGRVHRSTLSMMERDGQIVQTRRPTPGSGAIRVEWVVR